MPRSGGGKEQRKRRIKPVLFALSACGSFWGKSNQVDEMRELEEVRDRLYPE